MACISARHCGSGTADSRHGFRTTEKAVDANKYATPATSAVGTEKGGALAAAMAARGAAGGQTIVTMSRSADGDGTPRIDVAGGGAADGPSLIQMVPASELPDYKPVFANGAVKSDMDGHLWVRTIPTKATSGGAIYDVIDRRGRLIDRVQVPAGTTIAGFGAGGIVYLGRRDASGLHLQRIPVR